MASFNSTDLGIVEVCNTVQAPKERQVNAYPGVDGLQLIDHGTRGAITQLRGVLAASSRSGLATLLGTFRAYHAAGGKATLVDTYGVSWTNVILVQFRPIANIYPVPGGFCTRYEAEFLHPDV